MKKLSLILALVVTGCVAEVPAPEESESTAELDRAADSAAAVRTREETECRSDADCGEGLTCVPGELCFDWCEVGDPACCEGNVCQVDPGAPAD